MLYVTVACLLGLAAFALLFYVWIFIFISGSCNTGQAYDKFIMNICSSSGLAFFKTILTWGYLKRSFKNCLRHYRLKFFPVPAAELWKPCPEATLVDLHGNTKYLLKDYINQPSSMPIILNMGSYT